MKSLKGKTLKPLAAFVLAAAAVLAPLFLSDHALAQVTIPGPAQPGRAEEWLRNLPISPYRISPGPIVREGEGAGLPDVDLSLTIKKVVIEGSTVFDQGDFQPIFSKYTGREVPVAVIFQMAAEATAFYRGKGYILSQVIVPPQEVDGGVVRLQVVEGYVDNVVVEGEDGSRRDLVLAMTSKITRSRPLHSDDLERYLLLAGDLAGLQVQGFLSPSSSAPGAATLTVKTTYDRFEAAFQVANYGSEYVGPWTGSFGITENSLLGLHERIGVRLQTAPSVDELLFGEIVGSVPIGTEGTTVYGRLSNSASDPGNGLQQFGVTNDSLYVTVGARHPLIRSRRQNLFIDGRFDWVDLNSDSTTFGDISDDKLRVLRLTADYDFVDSWFGALMPAVTTISGRISIGLDAFGATKSGDPLASRTGADGTFTTLWADFQRQQRLPMRGVNLLVAARGQYAFEELLSSEEIGFGGMDFLRGYDPSTILGDRGIAGKAELQYTRPVDFGQYLQSYQLYAFLDAGVIENINFDGLGNNKTNALYSTGGGIRLASANSLEFDLGLAALLNDNRNNVKNLGTDNLRLLFKVTGRF